MSEENPSSNNEPSNNSNPPSENSSSTAMEEKVGLPPVAPPSGRFIAQLFLIPGAIVTVLVLIWLAGQYLVSERRDPEYFLRNLDSPNPDIRWRTAHDLAQVLKRPDSIKLASNAKFALDLAERLQTEWHKLQEQERKTAEVVKNIKDEKEKLAEWKKLDGQRNYVLFSISALGGFVVPAGAPLLCEIATEKDGPNVKQSTLRRRRAVWALANIGANYLRQYKGEDIEYLKVKYQIDKSRSEKFKILTEADREQITEVLSEEMKKNTSRGKWAKDCYYFLTEEKPLPVIDALDKCSKMEDTFLRGQVALALNFWRGDRVEAILIRLANDDGFGTRIQITEKD